MIRIRTSRSGWRDLYTSQNATNRLLSVEPQQGRSQYSNGGVIFCKIGSNEGKPERPDSVWLILDAVAARYDRCATILATFASPGIRELGDLAITGSVDETANAERELASIAATVDMLPDPPLKTAAKGSQKSTRALAIALLMGLLSGVCLTVFALKDLPNIEEFKKATASVMVDVLGKTPVFLTEKQQEDLVLSLEKLEKAVVSEIQKYMDLKVKNITELIDDRLENLSVSLTKDQQENLVLDLKKIVIDEVQASLDGKIDSITELIDSRLENLSVSLTKAQQEDLVLDLKKIVIDEVQASLDVKIESITGLIDNRLENLSVSLTKDQQENLVSSLKKAVIEKVQEYIDVKLTR